MMRYRGYISADGRAPAVGVLHDLGLEAVDLSAEPVRAGQQGLPAEAGLALLGLHAIDRVLDLETVPRCGRLVSSSDDGLCCGLAGVLPRRLIGRLIALGRPRGGAAGRWSFPKRRRRSVG